jgi:hypothetical protein
LSKIGVGTMQIEGRPSWPLVRATVSVRASGDADVTLSRLDGSTTFSGLIVLGPNTMRIMVKIPGTLTLAVSSSWLRRADTNFDHLARSRARRAECDGRF